mgnify:CR=1 FL=1
MLIVNRVIRLKFIVEFQKIFDRLNVKVEERGESFYQKMMQDLVVKLEQKGSIS